MTAKTQGLLVLVLGAVLVRVALTGEYLRFVAPWMHWPLLATGLFMLALGARPALGLLRGDANQAGSVPRSTWLMVLPVLVVFVVAPPPLGAYLAERRAGQAVSLPDPGGAPLAAATGPLPVGLDEFVWGAAEPGDPMELTGHQVQLTGFVSHDDKGQWYVTRLVIFCCAADAIVVRARVRGHGSPPRDQWVEVTGTWVTGTGTDPGHPPVVDADKVVPVATPGDPYA